MDMQREQWFRGSHTQACRGSQVPDGADGLQDAGLHVERAMGRDSGHKSGGRVLLDFSPSPQGPTVQQEAHPPVGSLQCAILREVTITLAGKERGLKESCPLQRSVFGRSAWS